MKSIMHSKSRLWRLSSAPVAVAAALLLGAVTPHAALASVNDTGRVIVGTDETMTVEISSDTIWDKSVFVDGVLRKTGSGKLTIVGEKLYGHGRIEVADGQLEVTATGAGSDAIAEPTGILAGAAMWLDASRHVAGPDGAAATDYAKTWFDVREENWETPAAPRLYIRAEGKTELSTGGLLPTNGVDSVGRRYVDFGRFGSGQYMLWTTPAGGKAWIPVFHSFMAYNPNGSHGNVLGSATSSGEDNSKQQYFATTSGSQTGKYFAQDSSANYNHLRNGRVFCNGVRVSVSDPIDLNALQILETESYPEGKGAEAFFNFRNFQQSAGSGSAGNRVGGGSLHEVLIFTNKVAETDRVVVGHWLLRKWVNLTGYGAMPAFAVARGATLSLPGVIASAAALESDGVVRIDGGTADIGAANAANPYAGLGGVLELDGDASVSNRIGAAVAASSGKSYDADAWNAVTVSSGTAGSIRKTGAGTLALAGLDSATTVAVDAGIASIRPPFAGGAAVTVSPNVISDGGFEGIRTDKARNYTSGTMGAWTVSTISGDSSSLAILSSSEHTTYGAQGAAEGSYRLVLKKGGGISQSVNLSKAGRYELTLRVTQRLSYRGFLRIHVGDVLIGTAQTTEATAWDFVRFETPWLAAGDHVVKIECETDVDVATLIDDVQMRWLDGIRAVNVPNGNFEDADWGKAGTTYSAINNAILNSNVLSSEYVTEWTVSGGVELLRALPYLRSIAKFEAPITGTGSISAFLPKGASISQTVTVPEDGLYRLSALMGQYVKAGTSASQTSASVRLSLGSAEETLTVANASVKRMGMSNAVRLSAGDTVTVAIASETVDAAYNNVVVDDVRLERLDNLVANPSFEGGGTDNQSPAGWTVAANPGNKQILYDGTGDNESSNFGTSVAEGAYRARLHAGTRLEQTIPLAAGLYRLSFWNVSRSSQTRVNRGPSPIRVTLAQGSTTNFCATVEPSASSIKMMRREFLVRVGEAGNWTLGFEATAGAAEDLSSFIDAVCLVPAGDVAADAVPDIGDNAAFSVATGATLGLDWPGVIEAVRFRVAGASLQGDVTAALAPESLYGIGTLRIEPLGTVIVLR